MGAIFGTLVDFKPEGDIGTMNNTLKTLKLWLAPYRAMFIASLAISSCLSSAKAYAEPGEAEQAFQEFYQQVANHRCEAAQKLSIGYSIAQCQNVKYLQPPTIKGAVESPDRVVFDAKIKYAHVKPAESFDCEYSITVVKRGRWLVAMPAKSISRCQPSQEEPPRPVEAQQAQPPAPEPLPPQEKAPPPPEKPAPTAPAAPPPSASTSSPVQSGPPKNLLGLWPEAALRGQPGEEHIKKLPKPDLEPPEYQELSQPPPKLDPWLADSIRRVRLPAGKNLVALTFDLCEQADDVTGYDRAIVNYLRDNRIPATFFAGGKWMQSHEERAMQLMADPLFEIGNHGWTHGNLRVLSGKKMKEQIVWTQAEYQRLRGVLGERARKAGLAEQMRQIRAQPSVLRFPYGTCSAESLGAVNDLGLGAIQWDVVSGDAAPRMTAQALARGVISNTRPGSIIVFHANGRGHGTAEALPGIVAALRGKGYSFATVSQLLQAGVPVTEKECYELKPGDNLYIDAKFGDGTGIQPISDKKN